ncbi:hypothetical protein IMZ31_18840 (plasmid) [Pontibacillus sp. ALD_SL1]|uniref:hypothetical protein n=1 Tax=Pontibacillus sp. ALD_SL1 TaxID=2777185 RepID=UPI001A97C57A|nr:hypothetical protein [Pontibacillus sp. ALD_SL1]QST02606.1 hypothetical protein IMZ31_18840 [Pontibacillus sp. ALD_SL1]
MKRFCEHCLPIQRTIGEERFSDVSLDWFMDLFHIHHPFLVCYETDGNGVSEGGQSFYCKKCHAFFTGHYDIWSDDDVITLSVTREGLIDREALARFLVLSETREELKEQLDKQPGPLPLYIKTDTYAPYTFSDGERYHLLDLHREHGLNHKTYSSYPHIHLSVEEAVHGWGRNDAYAKKAHLLSFDGDPKKVRIDVLPGPYGEAELSVSYHERVFPISLRHVDVLTGEETPLDEVNMERLKERDEEGFLKELRSLQERTDPPPILNMSEEAFEQALLDRLKELERVIKCDP